ncbi:DUF6197 family protein [Streptomyces sp. cg28]|uniref:DUF6197 family protein n=1 Tax=Streptomyces sp. cg28 TaxID=3403457 RepID=UPI003B223CB5
MSTILAPTRSEIATVIEKAADVIRTNGLHKGYLYDEQQAEAGTALEQCPVCLIGAINIAVYQVPRWPVEEKNLSPLAQEAVAALEKTIGEAVPGWNDDPARTKDDVITALTDTVNRLREV